VSADPVTTPSIATAFDPTLFAVLANRFDTIVREMTSTLLRTGRSAVISIARDFSCALLSAEDEMISCAEALPTEWVSGR
jgi:N-methylhydantoinase B